MTNSMSRMPPWPVLTFAIVGPFAFAPLLDPPLEGFDAGDVGPAEVAAIDPRFELLEQVPGPIRDRRPRGGL